MSADNPFSPLPTNAAPSRSIAIVLGCGLSTTLVTLIVNQILAANGTFLMGFYVNLILPVGALFVGASATSGYALGSWFGGRRVTGRLAIAVGLLSFMAYVAAQYGEYRLALLSEDLSTGDLSFFAYFDAATRAFAWDDHGKVGEAVGGLGYLMRLGEVFGFVGGGLLMPLVLTGRGYCESCAQYHRVKHVAWLGAALQSVGMLTRDKRPAEEHQAALQAAYDRLGRLRVAAATNNRAEWDVVIAEARAAPGGDKPAKLQHRLRINVSHCRSCFRGILCPDLLSGHGRSTRVTPLERLAMPEVFVRGLVG